MFDFRLFLPDGPGGFGGPGGGPGGPGDPGGFVPPKANYEEKRPETDWILSESAEYPGGIVLYEGHLPVAPEGKALLMTVDGVPTTIAAGTYAGKVVFTVYTLSNIPETEADMTVGDFRTALYMVSGKPVPTGLEAVAGDYRVNGTMLENVNMETNINDFNGVIFAGDGTKTGIRNSTFRFHGGGTSEGKGGCIMTVGNADVLIDNVEFWNKGTLTAIAGSGHSHIEVKNSVLYGARDFTVSKLCPWVLGINGNNRLTNAIESAQAYYHDSIVVAQSWAALSTDAGRGVHLHGENMFAGIGRLEPYNEAHAADYTAAPELNGKKYGFYLGNSAIGESGYINYADTGFHNTFKDVTFYSPDYIFILSTGKGSIDVEGDSYCYTGRNGVLWHKNAGGTVSFKGGKWYAEDKLFLVKTWAETDPDGCWCNAVCDGTDITLGKGGVLYQMMSSDDVGLGHPSTFVVPEIEQDLSKVERLPDTYRTQKTVQVNPFTKLPIYLVDGKETPAEGDVNAFLAAHPGAEPVIIDASYHLPDATLTLKNLKTAGDVFNGAYKRIQAVAVTLDNAELTGVISSAYTYHVDAEGKQCAPGTSYSSDGKEDEHLGIGRVGNTAAPAINNPVKLTLQNGAKWVPIGTSYLAELTFDAGSEIAGTVTVNGTAVTAPGSYSGDIVVQAQ